jgi:hypothetical protein
MKPGVSTQSDGQYDYTRPWQSNEERLTGEALAAAALDGPVDPAYNTRPPLPRTNPFPPRFGYGDRPAFGIKDIVNLDALYPGARVDYAQNNSGMAGTSFPALGVM